MPISAVDSINPAFEHTKQQLLRPFHFAQWLRLALVGLLAGELSSGGCNSHFDWPAPHHGRGSQEFLDAGWPPLLANHPEMSVGLILLLVVAGIGFFVLMLYISSVMRFILFDSIVAKECIPVTFAWESDWFAHPREHILALVLGGILLFLFFLVLVAVMGVVHVMTKDFVVPQMALEDVSAMEGWRRLWLWLKAEKGGYAGYIGMKIVLAIGAGIALGIISLIVIVALLIPVGGIGVFAVLGGKAAGLTWNFYTIGLAVVVGCIVLAALVFVISLISVPAIVFFPAYSIYFFAARYSPLAALLWPQPPASAAPSSPPLEPPPLPPAPAPLG